MNYLKKSFVRARWIPIAILLAVAVGAKAGPDQPTEFTNTGSMANTRHNLTQNTMQNGQGGQMNNNRNDYGAICVYCHTPHGANREAGIQGAPLWNRTYLSGTSYDTYDTLGTTTISDSTTLDPGVNSLTCLSCHDGTIAVDSIINMPGSGQYNAARENTMSDALLDAGPNGFTPGAGQSDSGSHAALNSDPNSVNPPSCLACHNNTTAFGQGLFSDATDFAIMAIGTDLTNDHPVGVQYPMAKIGDDFNGLDVEVSGAYAIVNDDGPVANRLEKSEVRLYDTGEGFEVECASCHDPHAVDDGGPQFIPTFLRVRNTESNLCQTCHNK